MRRQCSVSNIQRSKVVGDDGGRQRVKSMCHSSINHAVNVEGATAVSSVVIVMLSATNLRLKLFLAAGCCQETPRCQDLGQCVERRVDDDDYDFIFEVPG